MDRRSNYNNQRNQRNNRANDSNNKFRFNKNDANQPRGRQQPYSQSQQQQIWQAGSAGSESSGASWGQSPVQPDQSTVSAGEGQAERPAYVLTQLDQEAEAICSEVHSSIIQAFNSAHNMPLSEHVLYSSYESYDNIMNEQRRSLDEMMSKLSACSDRFPTSAAQQAQNSSFVAAPNHNPHRVEYSAIENLRDKYDTIHDFSEYMFDKIGQNLDDAAGLTSRDAKLVQATLQAAQQKRMSSHTIAQPSYSENISSPSPSLFPITKPAETGSHNSESFNSSLRQQASGTYDQAKVNTTQVNSVVQSTSLQQARGQSGGFLGKSHYASPNQRFASLENKNIPRPQNQFKDRIDNSYRPFEPLIRCKPNAEVPLTLSMERDELGNEHYSHPYEHEITNFPISPENLVPRDPIQPLDLSSTPIVLVSTVEQLEDMCRHIGTQQEFAVDVEHHSYRSFQGITCLVQISTRTQDFVIDAIGLRNELHRLNESFTNPTIVKVFHGADCDILWLQRDFGVYVVNLFDTSRAAKLMKFAHLSLAFLLKHYCNVDPDKSYQLADWRERPLPLPMLQYARADTHYLLYIYDRLRNDLLMRDGQRGNSGQESLKAVYERGREICLKRYEKPPFSDSSHLSILRKSRSTFNAKQMFAFKELYAWRDYISRELDESVGYVLPNNLMIRIAEYLPREPQGITALCNPIPPTVKKYLSDIHTIILKAIDVPLDETSKVMTGHNNLNIDPALRSIDLDTMSHKQDIAHSAGMQDGNVPNLLDKMYLLNCSSDDRNASLSSQQMDFSNGTDYQKLVNINQATSRLYNFLDASSEKKAPNKHDMNDPIRAGVHESIQRQFVSPYHRYIERNNHN